jgi:membrane fusion protein (multidrug efflux system)
MDREMAMLEVKDQVEAKPEQKKANGSGRSTFESPVHDVNVDGSAKPQPSVHQTETNHDPEIGAIKKPLYKRPVVLVVAAIVLVVGAAIGLRYWLYARSHESTDDAFIDGHIIQISPKGSGYVAKVYVDDNQQVKAGDLIVELDARDYQARLELAKTALDAALAKEKEARTTVSLTRAMGSASVAQAMGTVRRARSSVESARAGAASSQSRAGQASSAVSTAQANLEQARAQVLAAEAEATRAKADVDRYQLLFAKDEISRQQLDQAVATTDKANAQLDSARQRVVAATAQVNEARSAQSAAVETARQGQTQIGGAEAGVSEALGRLAQANTAPQQLAVSEAQSDTAGATTEQLRVKVDQAELELSYTKIYASEAGRVTRKAVEEGALVQIGQPLLAIVPGNVWVTANFKESQIGKMVPGQAVDISVDAYPDKVFRGHVDSIQAGTGAQFSLIPPENATGNYVKVVQRVPVKIVFNETPDPKHMLAPGMSVVPEVAVK